MERKPIYQAVISLEPFTIKEFKDFKSARKVESYAIIKKTFKQLHTTSYGNEYEIFNYSFLNIVEDLTKPLIVNNWGIEDIYEGYFAVKKELTDTGESVWWGASNIYSISDPNGELRTKSFASPEEAVENLIVFSKYQNWNEYETINPSKNK